MTTSSASSGIEESYDESRNPDDIKLIASLRKKIKVLKGAYIEEKQKTTALQQQLEVLLPKKRNLEEALAEKDSLCAKLSREILELQDTVATAQPHFGVSGRGQNVAELELRLSKSQKENTELREQLQLLKDNLALAENTLVGVKNGLVERMQELTKEVEETRVKLQEAIKERDVAKEEAEKSEKVSSVNFEQRVYILPLNLSKLEEKLEASAKEKESLIEELNRNKRNDKLKGEAFKVAQLAIQARDEEIERMKRKLTEIISAVKEYLSRSQTFTGSKGNVFKSPVKVFMPLRIR